MTKRFTFFSGRSSLSGLASLCFPFPSCYSGNMALPANAPPKPAAAPEIAPVSSAVAEKPPPPKEPPAVLQIIQTAESAGATPRQILSELAPKKETVDGLLKEASQLLFALKDRRILLTTLATEVAHNTPLGKELRREALGIVEDLKLEKPTRAMEDHITALQKKIKDAQLPARTRPEDSQFFRFLTNYNDTYPDQAVPKEYLADMLSGERDIAETVNLFLRQDKLKSLSTATFAALKGDKTEMKIPTTPADILTSAGLDPTKTENLKQMNEILSKKDKRSPFGGILSALMFMFMVSQVVQMAEGEPPPPH